MSLVEYAKKELDLIDMRDDSPDEMNREMRKCILDIIELFASQGHSGFSASYLTDTVSKLMRYAPLSPLTGEDDEWMDISSHMGEGKPWFQNRRHSSVFKDETGAYDIDGKVFVNQHGVAFTSAESRTPVTFPYTPTTEYIHIVENEDAVDES